MNGQSVLRETAELIEGGWCRGADARDRNGQEVGASDPKATAWSLLGALVAVSERPGTGSTDLRDALWGISGVIPERSLDAWNNAGGRTQRDTLEMLGRAQTSLGSHPPPCGGWTAQN
jgi:hypothetical protein